MTHPGLPEPPKPVAFHKYLTDSSGGLLAVFRLTNERCPQCALGGQLGIHSESRDGRSETVVCLTCDYTLTRPHVPPAGKRMNDGQR